MEYRTIYTAGVLALILIGRGCRIGGDKMLKCIIGNAFSGIACYGFGESLHLLSKHLMTTPEATIGGISYETVSHFFDNGQFTFILILFILLTILISSASRIQVSLFDNNLGKFIYILIIPLFVMSFFLSLTIALQGEGIQITSIISEQFHNYSPTTAKLIENIPIWIMIYHIIILLITHPLKFTFVIKRKNSIIPEQTEELG